MAGQGLDKIPLRVPDEWSADWFTRFVREVLALADVRNAKEGTGITISGNSDEQATVASSEDLTQFLTQPFVVADTSVLDNARLIEGDGEAISVTDTGDKVIVSLGYALTLDRLQQVDVLSVLGTPVDRALGEATLQAITSSTNDTVLRRVDDSGDDVLDWGQLTAGMFPNDVVPDAALSSNVALYDGDVASFSAGTFADGRVAESNVTQHQAALSIGFDQLTGTPQIPGGLDEYADDAAAEVGGVAVNGLYRTGSVVKIRVA